jgi:hypothetical protein
MQEGRRPGGVVSFFCNLEPNIFLEGISVSTPSSHSQEWACHPVGCISLLRPLYLARKALPEWSADQIELAQSYAPS